MFIKSFPRSAPPQLCREFVPHPVNIARYDNWIFDKCSKNSEEHFIKSSFQIRSRDIRWQIIGRFLFERY